MVQSGTCSHDDGSLNPCERCPKVFTPECDYQEDEVHDDR